jgi:hypothetical protein
VEYIAHRVNTIEELQQTPKEYGVEVDLRDYEKRLILQHDPFKDGEDFEEFLKHFNHGTMVLNIKSEGIEHKVIEYIHRYNIKKYFFLDSSFPMIYLLSKNNEKNIALRFSEYEEVDTILKMAGKVKWVWVDCFSRLPITPEKYALLKKNGFQLCLVSPELQRQDEKLELYKQDLHEKGIIFDAICTKIYNIKRW